ncbi:iron complex transport system ATP-binding protein [Tamaricihabitans halophyticus]|uniref:Iron complex transport system ATP-binding protein n=1 Tax=Tamaricihabitans halophyticus TaxID=1262583 RepID=A0A4R2QFM2_9PSEU|nr:ABC transporter ATP-binding protein [Tamaricihabitans halophyticus]TCP47940.1 iron complex transport system ATP-binding protein [Tamaricihabitans halophyticus]
MTVGLTLRDLSAGYRKHPVLHEVELDVPAGGWLAIIGANGTGKSTLLKAIAGLVPHTGDVWIGEHKASELGRRELARKLGYLPQGASLPDGLTVTDYVLLGRTPHLGALAREGQSDVDIVTAVLGRLDLSHLASRQLRTLSGGEQQRAVLARVLAQHTGVLLLDEPTTGLDIGHAQILLELVDTLRREDGTTVVSTLHDLTFAAQYADRIVLINCGRVVATGTPDEVLTAQALTEYYGARTTLLTAPDGSRVVAPLRGS